MLHYSLLFSFLPLSGSIPHRQSVNAVGAFFFSSHLYLPTPSPLPPLLLFFLLDEDVSEASLPPFLTRQCNRFTGGPSQRRPRSPSKAMQLRLRYSTQRDDQSAPTFGSEWASSVRLVFYWPFSQVREKNKCDTSIKTLSVTSSHLFFFVHSLILLFLTVVFIRPLVLNGFMYFF